MVLFWADQLASEIIERRKFKYIDKKMPEFKKYVVKTSASMSGVLHIGRLSDSIRGDSVNSALKTAGANSELIWVAEDMDPFRKVPEGVPKKYIEFIGMPVTDIPDPHGCHKNYVEHHKSEYFKVLDEFISSDFKKYSMRQEYRKGSFNPLIKKIMGRIDIVREIQNRYRSSPLPDEWNPWTPICGKCGKIITTKVDRYENGKVHYRCDDYKFEKYVAKGCGHEGENDPLKGNGKLMWKSEWAAQWARWGVVSEGAGKEYQVPLSAWWVNAEICEKVFDFPMPVPIFYEHLMIDNRKMSASLGNVVYPKDWLAVARAELLKFFYNRRLMKTRSFSWKDLPKLYEEYQRAESVFYGKKKIGNKKEEAHTKRLYELSQVELKKRIPLQLPFRLTSMAVQIFGAETGKVADIMKRTGHIHEKVDDKDMKTEIQRIKRWVDAYGPDEYKVVVQKKISDNIRKRLSAEQKKFITEFGTELEKTGNVKALCKNFVERRKIPKKEFFSSVYLVLFGEERGPRLADFIEVYGKREVAEILKGAK